MRYLMALLMMIPSMAMADVYVITAPDKSVYSVSEQDDAVVPAGYTKDIIKGKNIAALQIGDDVTLYSYSGKKFTADSGKSAKKSKDAQDMAAARQAKIDAKASAITKLKALGLTDAEISAIIGN